MDETLENFIYIARDLVINNDLKLAFDIYRYTLEKYPSSKEQYKLEFLLSFAAIIARMDDQAQIFTTCLQAFDLYPNEAIILRSMGKCLNMFGSFYAALCSFERARIINSRYACFESALNKTKDIMNSRSHFRVLNDKYRNEAYRKAIRQCVTPSKDNVLDITTGVGLLALYANECNPNSILVFETSEVFTGIADNVFKDNNANVELLKQNITNLDIPVFEKNLTVLLTDSIDSALFGRGILQTLCQAWEHLLVENSTVIPGKAEYFVVGIKCDHLNNKYQLSKEAKVMFNIGHMNVHVPNNCGYYSEDVGLYKHLEYVTEPISLFTIDFNNYHEVHAMLNRKEAFVADLLAVQDSEVNAIVGYFDLHLADNIHLTTNPRDISKVHAWQQAVFYDIIPTKLQQNEHIEIPFTIHEGMLRVLVEENTNVTRISRDSIAFLNDSVYMAMIERCVKTACVYLGQVVNISEVDIVDLSPFPVFGILMLTRGANSLVCLAKTVEDKRFLEKVLIANRIQLHKVSILLSDAIKRGALSDRRLKFHVIFHNIVQFNGDIDMNLKPVAHLLKLNNLVEGGLYLPEAVTMMAVLFNSKTLETNNKLFDQNVGYDIAKYMNRYQVSKVLNLNVSQFEYEPLSEEFKVFDCTEFLWSGLHKTLVTSDGECTGILCWYKIQMMKDWEEFHTNRSNSFVNSTAHLFDTRVVYRGNEVNVLMSADADVGIKLVLDVSN